MIAFRNTTTGGHKIREIVTLQTTSNEYRYVVVLADGILPYIVDADGVFDDPFGQCEEEECEGFCLVKGEV